MSSYGCSVYQRRGPGPSRGTLAGLIESLTDAKAAGNLSRRLRVLAHPALLVVDEIGYLPVNQEGTVLFFHK